MTWRHFVIAPLVVACATEPQSVRLAGVWEAAPGVAGFQHAGLAIFPPYGGLMDVEMRLSFPSEGDIEIVEGITFDPSPALTVSVGDSVRIALSLVELSTGAKENCDGDNFIDPNEPLCARLGSTMLRGIVVANDRIHAQFDSPVCEEHPFIAPCRDPPLDLSGSITFRLAERW